jgi:glycerol-3-phosphate dehydrogenase
MPRTRTDLSVARYDLLVVGGGIHGLFAAYDAATRGLSVALVDQDDFGSGLSFNHQRTIHGGLRALEHAHLGKARQQIHERRTWARIAPHLVRPLPFLVGTYRFTKRSRWLVRAGFATYDAIGRSRNRGVAPELHLPKARLESAAATKRLFPGIDEKGLSGGAIWYDYQTRHPDRLNWTVAMAAEQAGAVLGNYLQVIGPLKDGGRVAGARVRDLVTTREWDLQASVTLLAAGSGLSALQTSFGATGAPALVRAINVLLDRPARDIAVAAPSRSGRMLTAVPWRGYVLVGTYQSRDLVTGPEHAPPDGVIDEFLTDLNSAFPRLQANRADVRMTHHGLTPAVMRGGRADLMPEPAVLRHPEVGSGLLSLVGVKFTTARLAAETAVDAVCQALGRSRAGSKTASTLLPHTGIADSEGRLVETQRAFGAPLDRDILEHLTGWYNTEGPAVLRHAAEEGNLDRLAPGTPVLGGEVSYAAQHSRALRLSDVVFRRTPLGSAGHPGEEALARAADILTRVHGWSDARRLEELGLVEREYARRR